MSQVSPSVVATWVASHGDIASNHGFNISFLVGGWALPLWKMMEWVRQLGWWHFQLNGKNNPFMFQSPPTRYIIHWYSLVISHICIYNYIYIICIMYIIPGWWSIWFINFINLYLWMVRSILFVNRAGASGGRLGLAGRRPSSLGHCSVPTVPRPETGWKFTIHGGCHGCHGIGMDWGFHGVYQIWMDWGDFMDWDLEESFQWDMKPPFWAATAHPELPSREEGRFGKSRWALVRLGNPGTNRISFLGKIEI